MFDLYHNVTKSSHILATLTADTDGTTIDLQAYNSCLIGVYVGINSSYAAGDNFALELEHADESTVTPDTADTFSDVAETDLHGALAGTTTGRFALIDSTTEDDTTYWVGYTGGRRYVRVRFEATGTPGSSTFVVVILKGHPYRLPAA